MKVNRQEVRGRWDSGESTRATLSRGLVSGGQDKVILWKTVSARKRFSIRKNLSPLVGRANVKKKGKNIENGDLIEWVFKKGRKG